MIKQYLKYILIKFNLNFRSSFFFARLSSVHFLYKKIDDTFSTVADNTSFECPDLSCHICVQEFKLGYSDKKIFFNLF
jgi:hypothetical protein